MSQPNAGFGSQVLSGIAKAFSLIIVAVVAFWGYDSWNKQAIENEKQKLAPLRPGLSEFINAARDRQLGSSNRSMKPKVVFLTMDTNENTRFQRTRDYQGIDPLTLDLPPHLQPTNAMEVKTIAALYWGQKFVDTYDNGDSAYRQTCRVEVIDRESGQLIGSREFEGGEPPITIRTVRNKSFQTKHFGSSCDEQIIEYLASF